MFSYCCKGDGASLCMRTLLELEHSSKTELYLSKFEQYPDLMAEVSLLIRNGPEYVIERPVRTEGFTAAELSRLHGISIWRTYEYIVLYREYGYEAVVDYHERNFGVKPRDVVSECECWVAILPL